MPAAQHVLLSVLLVVAFHLPPATHAQSDTLDLFAGAPLHIIAQGDIDLFANPVSTDHVTLSPDASFVYFSRTASTSPASTSCLSVARLVGDSAAGWQAHVTQQWLITSPPFSTDSLESILNVAISPDGTSLYATASTAAAAGVKLLAFARDTDSGELTHVDTYDPSSAGVTNRTVDAVHVTADGKFVFTAGGEDDNTVLEADLPLAYFASWLRDAGDSSLTLADSYTAAPNNTRGTSMVTSTGVYALHATQGWRDKGFTSDPNEFFDAQVLVHTIDQTTGAITLTQQTGVTSPVETRSPLLDISVGLTPSGDQLLVHHGSLLNPNSVADGNQVIFNYDFDPSTGAVGSRTTSLNTPFGEFSAGSEFYAPQPLCITPSHAYLLLIDDGAQLQQIIALDYTSDGSDIVSNPSAARFALDNNEPAPIFNSDAQSGASSSTVVYVACHDDMALFSDDTGRVAVISQRVEPPTFFEYDATATSLTVNTDTASISVSSSAGGTVTHYSITPALPAGLTLDASTGSITGTPTEVLTATAFAVRAANRAGSITSIISIEVVDEPPAAFSYTSQNLTLGVSVTPIAPSSADSGLTFTIQPHLPRGLVLSALTGNISGTPVELLESAEFTVTATNSGGSTTAQITLAVQSATPSVLTYAQSPASYAVDEPIIPNIPGTLGSLITTFSASGLPAGLAIDSITGIISGTPTELTTATAYTITAINSGGSIQTAVVIEVVEAAATAFSVRYSDTVAAYTLGQTIASNTPTVSDDISASFAITPSLPNGLTLNDTTGVISGTALALSTDPIAYTVSATSALGTAVATVFISVVDATPNTFSYSPGPLVATVGTQATASRAEDAGIGGNVTSFSVSPPLPAGLTFADDGSGDIVGTPLAPSPATLYTVTAINSGGNTDSTISITVNAPVPSTFRYASSAMTFYVGEEVTTTNAPIVLPVVALEGASFALGSALPAGILFSSATGLFSGTPSGNTTSVSIEVTLTNPSGSVATDIEITVSQPRSYVVEYAAGSYEYAVGDSVSIGPPAVSSSGLSFSVTPALPDDLELAADTGVISGTVAASTPALARGMLFTIKATNTAGEAAQTVISLRLTDAAPPTFAFATTSPEYRVGEAIPTNTANLATAIPDGADWSVSSSPPLPSGLTLQVGAGSFAIVGTPLLTATPGAAFTVTLSTSGGSTQAVVTITVLPRAPARVEYSTPEAVYYIGHPLSPRNVPFFPEAGGCSQCGTLAFASNDTLPAGLSLDQNTGIISGTPSGSEITSPKPFLITVTSVGDAGAAPSTTEITIEILYEPPLELYYREISQQYSIDEEVSITAPTVAVSNAAGASGASYRFAVAPSLPSGLSLNTTSGAISGTATPLTPLTVYTIEVSNNAGTVHASLSLHIVDLLPQFSYPTTEGQFELTRDMPVPSPIFPTVSIDGGAVAEYSIVPSLPTGLSFSTTSGAISGTPIELSPSRIYVITASNTGGSSSTAITLQVAQRAPGSVEYSPQTFSVALDGNVFIPPPSVLGGGTVDSFSINPPFTSDSGLVFNTATGGVSGTALQADAFGTLFQVTAENSAGSSVGSFRLIVRLPADEVASYFDPASTGVFAASAATYAKESEVKNAELLSFAAVGLAVVVLLLLILCLRRERRKTKKTVSREVEMSSMKLELARSPSNTSDQGLHRTSSRTNMTREDSMNVQRELFDEDDIDEEEPRKGAMARRNKSLPRKPTRSRSRNRRNLQRNGSAKRPTRKKKQNSLRKPKTMPQPLITTPVDSDHEDEVEDTTSGSEMEDPNQGEQLRGAPANVRQAAAEAAMEDITGADVSPGKPPRKLKKKRKKKMKKTKPASPTDKYAKPSEGMDAEPGASSFESLRDTEERASMGTGQRGRDQLRDLLQPDDEEEEAEELRHGARDSALPTSTGNKLRSMLQPDGDEEDDDEPGASD